MTKIQIDLSKQENKAVEIYKANHGLKNKRIAIKKMLLGVKQ